MRIAFFTETFLPKVDGIVTVTCLLLDHLAARGIESVIVAPRLWEEIDQYAATRVIRVRSWTLPLYPELKMGPPTLATYRQLREFNPDLVHIIHPVILGTGGMVIAKRLNVPIVASFHLDFARLAYHYRMSRFIPWINWAHRFLFNRADYALAPSRAIQRDMLRIGIREVGLWQRGVDAEKFHPRYYDAAMRHAMSDGHPEDTLLLYVGRLGSEKRLHTLRAVLDQVPGTRLALVGDGPERANLEAHFSGTNTRFMGYLTGEALSQAYASADVFVFPSASETFGLVITEAMAAGLPVVASRVGGVPDVIQEGRTGYTFAVDDTRAMIEGVRRVIHDPVVLGQMARAYAETQTWPAMMDEVIAHYHRLIST